MMYTTFRKASAHHSPAFRCDDAELGTKLRCFSWRDFIGAILFLAVLICAVMPAFGDELETNVGNGIVIGDFGIGKLFPNINSAYFPSNLSNVRSGFVEPVIINNFSHQVSVSFAKAHLFKVGKCDSALGGECLMWPNNLRKLLNVSFFHYYPRFTQGFECRSAFEKQFHALGWCVSTIYQWSNEDNSFSHVISGVLRQDNLRFIHINKCALADNIVLPNEPCLPCLHAGVSQYRQQSENRDIMLWLLPITLCIVSLVWFYHGMPRLCSLHGVFIVAASSISWIVATFISLAILAGSALFNVEDTSASHGSYDSSPRYYGRVEKLLVGPIAKAPFEFHGVLADGTLPSESRPSERAVACGRMRFGCGERERTRSSVADEANLRKWAFGFFHNWNAPRSGVG